MTEIKNIQFPPTDDMLIHYCDNCKEYVETREVDIPHDFFDDEPIGICYRCMNCDYPIEDIFF